MNKKHDKAISFKGQDFYIGIDVHKKQWTIVVISMNMRLGRSVTINPSAESLYKYLTKRYPGGNYYAVYEAGFSGFKAARDLNKLGIKCKVIHAADVPTSQKERLNKNDRIDANKLARSLSNHELKGIYIPEKKAEEYRSLNRYRLQKRKDLTRIKNRIKSFLYYYGIQIPIELEGRRWSGAFIKWLSEQKFDTDYGQFAFNNLLEELISTRKLISNTLKKMREMSRDTEPFAQLIPLLLTVPGIGFITAMTLATELIDINRFKRLEHLANYVGLVPSIQSTDEKEFISGISRRRNKHLRSMLIEAAWKAVKIDEALTMKFNNLSSRMPRNKAIVRIAKILLSRVRHVWKEQEPYVMGLVS